ncbi:MAG: shikimate dehydrogenase [Lentisphaeria bacterium]|nr:shikimate dehydrogenase [Lentisphaeria bacterium]
MIKFAVIGDPIAHSLSPAMHNAALEALDLQGNYEAVRVPLEELPDFADYARKNLNGFNITVPHKQNIIPLLDEITEAAAFADSVNTVTVKDGKLYGDSTDGYGLATALNEAFGLSVHGAKIVFIGCGGAAHAVATYFAMQGAARISILNRSVEKAKGLAGKLKTKYPEMIAEAFSISDPEMIKKAMTGADVAIQCTSLGLKPDDPAPIPPELLPDGICYYDTIYKRTALYQAAETKGLRCSAGLGMLLHQGARSLEIWTGRKAPIEVMREALETASGNRR